MIANKKEMLKVDIRFLVREHGVLNISQICRGLNKRAEWKDRGCNVGKDKLPAVGNKIYPHCKKWKCYPTYFKLLNVVKEMEEEGRLLIERKMRFWDSKYGAKIMDVFSFCYLDRKAFDEIILSQTLIPYVEGVE